MLRQEQQPQLLGLLSLQEQLVGALLELHLQHCFYGNHGLSAAGCSSVPHDEGILVCKVTECHFLAIALFSNPHGFQDSQVANLLSNEGILHHERSTLLVRLYAAYKEQIAGQQFVFCEVDELFAQSRRHELGASWR